MVTSLMRVGLVGASLCPEVTTAAGIIYYVYVTCDNIVRTRIDSIAPGTGLETGRNWCN